MLLLGASVAVLCTRCVAVGFQKAELYRMINNLSAENTLPKNELLCATLLTATAEPIYQHRHVVVTTVERCRGAGDDEGSPYH